MLLDFADFQLAWIIFSTVLIIIGLICLIIEIQVPGFGVFGVSGIFCMVVGFFILISVIENKSPGIAFYLKAIMPLAILVIIGAATVYKISKSMKEEPEIGKYEGKQGFAIEDFGKEKDGFIMLEGEYWKASSDDIISKDDEVEIVKKEREKLIVKKMNNKTKL
ncbi:MAG: hypothetical protein GX362_05105 [Methanosarcinaceae archaeon]|nr:hypothetical protein [Methanosarcinaceae archaeon]